MENKLKNEDELVNGTVLASRLMVTTAFISKYKKKGVFNNCMDGKKYWFRKACLVLGRNPDNIKQSKASIAQEKIPKKQYIPKEHREEPTEIDRDAVEDEAKKVDKQIGDAIKTKKDSNTLERYVLSQIQKVVIDKESVYDRNLLDGTKIKMQLLKEYHITEQEKLKTKKLEGNLFDREEVVEILSFSINIFRNSLINLANNYAVNLEGLSQKKIKEFVANDINHILEDLRRTSDKFIIGM